MIVHMGSLNNLTVTLDPRTGVVQAHYGQTLHAESTVPMDTHARMVRSTRLWIATNRWFT